MAKRNLAAVPDPERWDTSKIDIGELDNLNQILRRLSNLCIAFDGGPNVDSGVDFAFAASSLVLRAGMVLDRQLAAANADTLGWADQI